MFEVGGISDRLPGRLAGTRPLGLVCHGILRAGGLAVVATVAVMLDGDPAAGQQLPGQVERGIPRIDVPDLEPVMPSFSVELPGGTGPAPGAADETVAFEDALIDGVTVYGDETFEPLLAGLRGREITLEQLFGIAAAIQKRYVEDGYFLSFAYLPPQTVDDGNYRIQVVEGYVASVTVEGSSPGHRARVRDLLDGLAGQRPARLGTVERALLLADDLNGITVSGTLRPAETGTGASDLLVAVSHDRVEIGMGLNNRGSKYTGPWQFVVSAGVNSLAVVGDAVRAELLATSVFREQRYGRLEYDLPVLDTGARLTFSVAGSLSEPGYDLDQFDTTSKTFQTGIGLSYPILRRRRYSLEASVDFSSTNVRVKFGEDEVFFDRLRTLGFTLIGQEAGFLAGRTAVVWRYLQGVDVFDASSSDTGLTSRADAVQTARRTTLDISRLQRVHGDLSLLVQASGQYAFDPPAASEEFSVGGEDFGRAYDDGEIVGDHGVAALAELRYDQDVGVFGLESVQPYGFYDVGITWDQDRSVSDRRDTLTSAGFGLRADMAFGLSASLEFAKPLTRSRGTDDDDDRAPRIYLGARYDMAF